MQTKVIISLSMMRELVQSPRVALVLQERWKYSTWETHRGRTGRAK